MAGENTSIARPASQAGLRDVILPPHLQGAKIAFDGLVSAYGGQVAASAETGKSQQRISAYGHRNTADFPPIDVIDTLEARTVGLPGHPHITRWLCRRRGGEFVPLPDPVLGSVNWSQLLSSLAREHGELTSGVIADLQDNSISVAEARARLKDAAELRRVVVEFEHALRMRAAEEA